jgi:luciferase family oxidoreductase group 1
VQAVPGGGSEVPLWILGSSTYGAQLAAFLGLPYAFASHFAPDDLLPALEVYRSTFQPSRQLEAPYAMAGINVFAADTDDEARRLFTSVQQSFANRLRGNPSQTPPPVDDIDAHVTPEELAASAGRLTHSIVGSPDTVRAGIERFNELTGADELMVVSNIYDHDARVRSYEILADAVAPERSERAGSS